MATELTIDFTGPQLRDIGIRQSEFHANQVEEKWSDIAYRFAVHFCKYHRMMMMEDIRTASKGKIPDPPHARAWGAIALKLMRNGVIEKLSIRPVQNPKAHCANAQFYESKIYYWK